MSHSGWLQQTRGPEECENGIDPRPVPAAAIASLLYSAMDAALVLLGLVVLIGGVGGIALKAWSVNKEAERLKAAEDRTA